MMAIRVIYQNVSLTALVMFLAGIVLEEVPLHPQFAQPNVMTVL